jgi:hypothetical protein
VTKEAGPRIKSGVTKKGVRFRGRGEARLPELEKRRRATQATKDHFIGRPFDWREGRHCVQLAHYHLRKMGKRPPALPRIRGPEDARRELAARGWNSVAEMLDSLLERIPPAMMRLGEIAVTPGSEGLESVVIYLGPRMLLGWLPDGSRVVIYDAGLGDLSAAWRV